MLEKPALNDQKIVDCLQDHYGLRAAQIDFLPLGADSAAAVYRVSADDGRPYFLKLRRGGFNAAAVALPKYLSDQGLAQIIPSRATLSGALWGRLNDFSVLLYPFVEGRHGYEVALSERNWAELGAALRQLHNTAVPAEILAHIRREGYTDTWHESVRRFVERAAAERWHDPVAQQTAALLHDKREAISDLVARSERLSQMLQRQPPDFVVCHADLHAGNVLIDERGTLFIVDWDTLILAPKERDLMFIGGGMMANWRTPHEEEALFYPAYGSVPVNQIALAYYRYARIIEDIAVYCEELLLSAAGGADREQSFRYLASNFLPNQTIELAYRADRASLPEA